MKHHKKYCCGTVAFSLIICSAVPAWASEGAVFFSGLVQMYIRLAVAALVIVAYAERREEIGGWLLLFYFQNYYSLISGILHTAAQWQSLLPHAWDDKLLYFGYIAMGVSWLAVATLVLVMAERLRNTRSARFLLPLRIALLAALLVCATGDFVRVVVYDTAPEIGHMIWYAVWLMYFSFSDRVKRVFVDKTWVVLTAAILDKLKMEISKDRLVPSCVECTYLGQRRSLLERYYCTKAHVDLHDPCCTNCASHLPRGRG